MGEPEIGTIRCLDCAKEYEEAPERWECEQCGGPVSQIMGVIHVGRPGEFSNSGRTCTRRRRTGWSPIFATP